MPSIKRDYILIDAKNYAWKVWYTNRFLAVDGVSTGILYGMLVGLLTWSSRFGGKPIVVWDGGRGWRGDVYPDYKGKRNADPNDRESVNAAQQQLQVLFSKIGMRQVHLPPQEADDVIAYLVQTLAGKKVIISSDKDFYQLLSADVQICNGDLIMNASMVLDQFGVTPKQWVFYRALTGDTSDNIAGVGDVGPVKARALVNECQEPDVDFVYTDRVGTKLGEKSHILVRNRMLMELGVKEWPVEDLTKLHAAVNQTLNFGTDETGIMVLENFIQKWQMHSLWDRRKELYALTE